MQAGWRRLEPGELDHELIWLSVSLLSLVLGFTWLAWGLPWPHCLFLAMTGHPCMTCGATRAVIAFARGHFVEALRWNPLAFVAFCAISLFDVYAAVVLITRAPRLRFSAFTSAEKRFVRLLVVAALAFNWAYLLINSRAYLG